MLPYVVPYFRSSEILLVHYFISYGMALLILGREKLQKWCPVLNSNCTIIHHLIHHPLEMFLNGRVQFSVFRSWVRKTDPVLKWAQKGSYYFLRGCETCLKVSEYLKLANYQVKVKEVTQVSRLRFVRYFSCVLPCGKEKSQVKNHF